ncbi:DUF6252 family protein [Carboxylicivirga sp. RSCT41]|uniref:DUF6252 family protein n=1 Tax=Carboxylicivirga agarovorans TaxID=3417570 RepID=UPI003D33354E
MTKPALLTYTLIALTICIYISCKKETQEPELPLATQNGDNTFGCLVNGEVWLPKKGMITTPPLYVSNNSDKDKRWTIIANNSLQTVNLTICKDSVLNGSSTFKIESINNCSSARFNDSSNDNKEYFFTDGDNYNGKVTITRFDLDARIISGTFYFDAISDKGNVVEIRDGRFDLQI